MDGLTVSSRHLAQQMSYIRNYCKPMKLGKLVSQLQKGGAIDPRTVVVTFDDGYADTFYLARPILQRFGIPATIFVTTGYIDGHYRPFENARSLTWKNIKQMAYENMEIGSHTVSHPVLTACSLRKAEFEIQQSKKKLEDQLGRSVSLFAYPYGHARSFNRRIEQLVKDSGYLAACTTLQADNLIGINPYRLRRISFGKNWIREFAIDLQDCCVENKKSHSFPAIFGLNKHARKLWRKRYAWIGQKLSRQGLFDWSKGSS